MGSLWGIHLNNLTFTKIWHDETEDFCEIEVIAESDSVKVRGRYYVADDTLSDLALNLQLFLYFVTQTFKWKTGKRGPGYTPDFEISALYTDMAKHIRFNIFMELDDIRPNKFEGIIPDKYYSCSFYIDDLENGPLYEFSKNLSSFSVGKTISVY